VTAAVGLGWQGKKILTVTDFGVEAVPSTKSRISGASLLSQGMGGVS
jgi:hypothetical protein